MNSSAAPTSDLVKQTLRTVIVLVTVCVVFVGALSGAAVAITARAFKAKTTDSESTATAAAKTEGRKPGDAKPDAVPAKKPQSI